MTDDHDVRWTLFDPVLPLGCGFFAGWFAEINLDVLPAPLVFIGVSVAVFLTVSFAVHVCLWSWERRLTRRLLSLDSEILLRELHDDVVHCERITYILLSRGVSTKELADYALFLLLSSSDDERWVGWCNLGTNFPEIKEQLIALDPDIKRKLVGIDFPHGPPETVPHLIENLRSQYATK